jgi:acyl-CoA thioester hydrolase
VSTWTAPVRYAEVDGQGVVFNSHYLLYCDEAMTAFCQRRELLAVAERVKLVSSTLNWTSAARWGDVLEVDVTCPRVGRTSFLLAFDIRVGERKCCHVETTYVLTDGSGRATPLPDEAGRALTSE